MAQREVLDVRVCADGNLLAIGTQHRVEPH
eukprot:COSAG02_NODE_36589_length_453_cov_0.514124_1_plen_29_part_10